MADRTSSLSRGNLPGRPNAAWQPFTFRGVAAFAGATTLRALTAQLLIACVVGAATAFLLFTAWLPVITEAIANLPEDGRIRRGNLEWPDDRPRSLAQGRFLAIVVDPTDAQKPGNAADFVCEFGRQELRLHSVLGYLPIGYPRGWVFELNRTRLDPWWGAWSRAVAVVAVGLEVILLLMYWGICGIVLAGPVRVMAALWGRECSTAGAWRMASVAVSAGAVLLVAAMILYAIGQLDLVRLTMAWPGQLVLGLVYALLAPCFLPRDPGPFHPSAENPFKCSEDEKQPD